MRHVHPQQRADFVRNRAEGGVIEVARVGARSDRDHFRLDLQCLLAHLIHVDATGVRPVDLDAVEVRVVEDAAEVDRAAVRQVTAVRQVEAKQFVAGLHQRQVDGGVGLGPTVRLHIDPVDSEQFFGPIARQILGDVGKLAPAVVALARKPLGVFVRQRATLRLHNCARREVLRSDQFQPVLLALRFVLESGEEFGILSAERFHRRAAVG